MRHLGRAVGRSTFTDRTCLMARVGDSSHISACLTLLEQFRFAYEDREWETLKEMFRRLLTLGAMQICLVEDRRALEGSAIVAFCASVFVSDEFCCEARGSLPPYLGAHAAGLYLEGKLSFLGREQVASANTRAGVNVITCYCGYQFDSLPPEHVLAVREKLAESFRLAYQGYKLKELLCAPIGEETLNWALDAGFRLRRDYSEFYHRANLSVPEPGKRPWLVGLTKEEALADYGSRASGLFVFLPPRFHFNTCEQALLRRSLAGETDQEMASTLAISPWTVKKRWQAIYQRVVSVDRKLLPTTEKELGLETRGAERRRHLIAYLRQHLEELRPQGVIRNASV